MSAVTRSLFAYCSDAICIADDRHISFYAPKTLKKFRVQHFSDHRVAGLHVSRRGASAMLHVVDTTGNYMEVDLKTITVVRTATIQRPGAVGDASSKPTVHAKRNLTAAAGQSRLSSPIVQASFYTMPWQSGGAQQDDLRCVILTEMAVYDVSTADLAATSLKYTFPTAMSHLTMDVGARSGVVAIGQPGQRWLYALPAGPVTTIAAPLLQLNITLQSVACHPELPSVAIGGARGELAVYPSIHEAHCFSDHWHHTALQALCFSADGSALYSGAGEGVMLLWNLSSYTFKKVGVHMGPIRAIVVNEDKGTQVILPCSHASLASVDLLRQTVDKSLEGAQWTSGAACTGLVTTSWMGQQSIVLTGLPDVVRVCDPLTQQAYYSLHIATQLETAEVPVSVGVRHVGIMDDGRVLATVEDSRAASLGTALRIWVYDAQLKRHVEAQAIYQPHAAPVIALCVDSKRRRVFTLCRSSIKIWAEGEDDLNDATVAGLSGFRRWRCVAVMPTPTCEVTSMTLSDDGSVCFVADDVVRAYGVGHVSSGVQWPLLRILTQDTSLASLHHLEYNASVTAVAACNAEAAFIWSLKTGAVQVVSATPSSRVVACCWKATTLVCVFSDGAVREVNADGAVAASSPADTVRRTTRFMRWLGESRFAVVDEIEGYRTVHLDLNASRSADVVLFDATSSSTAESGNAPPEALRHFFKAASSTSSVSPAAAANKLQWFIQASEARQWLDDVLGASAYTAPPVSSVLSSYLANLTTGIETVDEQ